MARDSFTYQANDGNASSGTVTVTITVTEVNDPPGFTAGPNVEVSTGIIPTPFSQIWATGISPGPGESGQTVQFQITTDAPPLTFLAEPTISPEGTLEFTPLIALLEQTFNATVIAQDSQGAQSAQANFTITLRP